MVREDVNYPSFNPFKIEIEESKLHAASGHYCLAVIVSIDERGFPSVIAD
jgi:hypothetical protein